MIVISSTKLAKSLDGRAGARLPSTIQRWPGRNSHEILPGLFLNWVIAGAAFAIRQLPGMATFSPMILSMAIGIAFQNIVGTAAWAKQGVTFSLRWLLRTANFPFGLQLTSSQVIEIGGGGLGIIAATVRACFAFTIWMGQLLGVEMYGTSSSDDKLARVAALGLQHGINYKQVDYQDAIKELTHGEGVDAVFEMLGGPHVAKSVKCLRDFGRVIVYGAATGEPPLLDTRLLYAKGASVHGLWLTYLSQNASLMEMAWTQLSQWVQEDKLHPVIGKVFPLEEARAAYRLIQEGQNFGKIVLKIA